MNLPPSLSRPRHLAATLLVFLLAGGAGGVVVALAAADAPDAPFAAASPHQGDVGRYELQKAPLDEDGARRGFEQGPGLSYRFSFTGAEPFWDADGVAHGAWNVHVDTTDDRGDRSTVFHVDPDTGRVLGSQEATVRRHTRDASPSFLVPSTSEDETTWTTTRFTAAREIPCGLLDPWQGTTFPVAGEVLPYETPCAWGPGERDPNAHHVVVRGRSGAAPEFLVVDHHRTHPSDTPRPGDRPDWRAWYVEGIPYPVRMLDVTGGSFGAPGDTLLLTGFERGDAPMPSVPPSRLADLPPLDEAPLTEWTIPDSGVSHPWPLHRAYAHARDDPGRPGLRDFLAAHPDAYVAFARHAAFDADGRHSERWEFAVVDGDALHHVLLSQQSPSTGVLAGVDRTPLTYQYQEASPDWLSQATFPPRDRLPARLPTASSLLSWWDSTMGDTAHPDASPSYSVLIRCREASCDTVDVEVGAGAVYYHRVPGPGYPVLDERVDAWETTEMFWQEGSATHAEVTSQVQQRSVPTALSSPPAGDVHQGEALATVVQDSWSWPSPAQAVGVGLGALLLALVYWLSPTLKALPLGLFSRVRREALLENPHRHALMDLIERRPGIHRRRVVAATGLANGTIDHHLRKLEDGGLVTVKRTGGYACYFPTGRIDHGLMSAVSAVKSTGARTVLQAVRSRPGTTMAELAHATGLKPQTVHYHLQRLDASGLVTLARNAGSLSVRPTDKAAAVLGLAASMTPPP